MDFINGGFLNGTESGCRLFKKSLLSVPDKDHKVVFVIIGSGRKEKYICGIKY